MAYGYNDGDQRPQSVRLAGRTTPTPRSTSDNDNPQRPQEQPGASSRQQSRTVQQSDRVSTSTLDPAWSELPYAGGTIRENACGPTCLTMVYIFKTGQTDKTPVDVCALAEAGNYAPTGATEWSFMTGGAWQLGLNGTQLYNDRESITQALRSGAPVIAAVRPGTFTNVGHYIVLYGIDDANQIGVYDPNSASRSARRWGVVEVLNEVEAMWAYY